MVGWCSYSFDLTQKLVSSHIKENKGKKRARSEQSSPKKEKGKKMVKGAEE